MDIDHDKFQSIGNVADKIVADAAEKAGFTNHEDGIWFSMPDSVYHADTALGSTGLKKLVNNAPDYWWSSPLNPYKDEDDNDDTAAKVFGRQLHQCVLEGVDKFTKLHAPRYLNGATKEGKAEKAEIESAGKTPIKFKDYGKILAASAFIKANQTLANAFENGEPEVSIFWTVDGIRFKARLDYLKLNAITDLKSITNMSGKPFPQACRDALATYDYFMSAEHYREGRAQMARLLKQGKVFGEPMLGMDWLKQVALNEVFSFVFVFWQKKGAPISHGIKMSPGNPLFSMARDRITRAVENYQTYMAEFGTNAAWVPSPPLEEADESELPPWYQRILSTGV